MPARRRDFSFRQRLSGKPGAARRGGGNLQSPRHLGRSHDGCVRRRGRARGSPVGDFNTAGPFPDSHVRERRSRPALSLFVRCARGSCGCRHARIARGSGRWALREEHVASAGAFLPPGSVGRAEAPADGRQARLVAPRRAPWTNVGSQRPDPRPRKLLRWSAGRGEEVVAGLLAAAAGSGADPTVVVVRGVPVTLLARQAAAQAWIVARRTPTSPADWRVTMRPAAARRHQRDRG
jgi:hypothetical protein